MSIRLKKINEETEPYLDCLDLCWYEETIEDCYLILKDNHPVGAVSYETDSDNVTWLGLIEIEEKYKNQGIATFVMKNLIPGTRIEGLALFYAIPFWVKLGVVFYDGGTFGPTEAIEMLSKKYATDEEKDIILSEYENFSLAFVYYRERKKFE